MSSNLKDVKPYTPSWHGRFSKAALGHCSWHGWSCQGKPVVSFIEVRKNGDRYRQSGCQRVIEEQGLRVP